MEYDPNELNRKRMDLWVDVCVVVNKSPGCMNEKTAPSYADEALKRFDAKFNKAE